MGAGERPAAPAHLAALRVNHPSRQQPQDELRDDGDRDDEEQAVHARPHFGQLAFEKPQPLGDDGAEAGADIVSSDGGAGGVVANAEAARVMPAVITRPSGVSLIV